VNASLFEQQINEVTSVGIGLQQRLLGALRLSLGFNYSVNDFKATGGPQLIVARTDTTQSYTAGLDLPFLKHGDVGVFYSYNQNSSSQPGFGFSSSEVGVSLSLSY